MKPGYVYILSNPSMPGLIKIGRSIHGGSKRAKELNQTGIPTPFILHFEIFDNFDHIQLEKFIHLALKDFRVNAEREFFKITIEEATKAVIDTYLSLNFLWNAVESEEKDAISNIYEMASHMQIDGRELLAATRCLTPFALRQAVVEWRKFLDQKRASKGAMNG